MLETKLLFSVRTKILKELGVYSYEDADIILRLKLEVLTVEGLCEKTKHHARLIYRQTFLADENHS